MLGSNQNNSDLLALKEKNFLFFMQCCKKQKKALAQKDYQQFFSLQEEKIKIIEEIEKINKFLPAEKVGQEDKIRRKIKKRLKEILKAEQEIQEAVKKEYVILQSRLAKLSEGLHLIQNYKWGKKKRSKFLDLRG